MTENNNLKNQSDKKNNKEDDEEEKKHKIESLTKAGKIAQEVKKYIKPQIQVGTVVLNLIENTEKKIVELGGGWAFPVNVSIHLRLRMMILRLKKEILLKSI